jgi:Mg/Co/Ni transporter MgtE
VAGKQNWLAAGLPTEGKYAVLPRAKDFAHGDVPTAELGERVGDVRARAEKEGWDAAVVVNEERVVLGLLRSRHLESDPDRRVEEAMQPGPSTFRPHVLITELAELMEDHDLPNVTITTGEGVLVGVIRREEAVEAVRKLHEAHDHG